MAKSRPGQAHHYAPASESPFAKDYAALQAERERLREDRRKLHEMIQALGDETRKARQAQSDLAEAVARWESQRATVSEATRKILKEVIAGELAPFRQSTRDQCRSLAESLVKAQTTMTTHMVEVLEFDTPDAFMHQLAKEVTGMLLDDLKERRKEPTAGWILEIVGDSLLGGLADDIKVNARPAGLIKEPDVLVIADA